MQREHPESISCDLEGNLCLQGAAVATGVLGYVYYRRQWVVSPRHVYRLAMLKMKQDPGVTEVLGQPIAASFPRAFIITAGGPRLKVCPFSASMLLFSIVIKLSVLLFSKLS